MPIKLAAEAEGISEDTIHDWIARGKKGEPKYEAFSRAVTRAKAIGAKNLVVRGLAGGKGSSAATWFLERRYRDHYGPPREDEGKKSEVTIVVEGGLPRRPQ
jgi:hypothetical protein